MDLDNMSHQALRLWVATQLLAGSMGEKSVGVEFDHWLNMAEGLIKANKQYDNPNK